MDTCRLRLFACAALAGGAFATLACESPRGLASEGGGVSATAGGQPGALAGAGGASTAGTLAPAAGAAAIGATGGAGAGGASAQGGAGAGAGDAGAGAGGDTGSAGGTAASCAPTTHVDDPFGCAFAWGTNDPGGSLASFAYLDFMSKWVGYEVDASGALARCDGCSWLTGQVASTDLIPVYYAYFIGYFGHANGFQDGNVDPNAPNLTTDGAALIREHRAAIVEMYAWYARESRRVWSDKPLVWLLEGDFVQYAGESQEQPFSYGELAGLAAEIGCAIKSEMPNAVVAINHSTWNPDQVTSDFWGAIDTAGVAYDLVWTTGVANNDGFFEAAADLNIYNHATATYAYVHELTGRKLLVDTSFGLSAMGDTWSAADAATLNARIADGVIAANVATPPAGYEAAIGGLSAALATTCE